MGRLPDSAYVALTLILVVAYLFATYLFLGFVAGVIDGVAR